MERNTQEEEKDLVTKNAYCESYGRERNEILLQRLGRR